MISKEYMDDLKSRYINARNEKERDSVRELMREACDENPESVAAISIEQIRESIERIDNTVVRQQMRDIIPMTSMAYIAKTYFNKSRQWLYQRVNGNIVNGKPASFTQDEIEVLNRALNEIGTKLMNTRVVLCQAGREPVGVDAFETV